MNDICLSDFFVTRNVHGKIIAMNELIGTPIKMDANIMAALARFVTPMPRKKALSILGHVFSDDTQCERALQRFIEVGILTEDGASLSVRERSFNAAWPYGRSTASHALALSRLTFNDKNFQIEEMAKAIKAEPDPHKVESDTSGTGINIDLNSMVDAEDVFKIFSKRRSARKFKDVEISVGQLGAVLYGGLAVVDHLHLPLRSPIPLRYTPSPGALASVSGYIITRSVTDLPSGAYQYNGSTSSLRPISGQQPSNIEKIFGNQAWAARASALIVLVADLSKMAWKYSDPGAYNASLIEAGHIAQNMAVTAGNLGLSTVFTNAIDAEKLCEIFSLPWPRKLPIYSVALGDARGIENAADDYDEEDVMLLKKLLAD
jgi:SagB-type dehydrogenase domain